MIDSLLAMRIKFSFLVGILVISTVFANKLKKVNDCVCYCPSDEGLEDHDPDSNHGIDYNYITLPGRPEFVTHYHRRKNSTSNTSQHTSTKRHKTKKVTKRKYTKKQIEMIQRAGENLIMRYRDQARLGYRSNMGR